MGPWTRGPCYHDSLAKTFSPGILMRSTCGKSRLCVESKDLNLY